MRVALGIIVNAVVSAVVSVVVSVTLAGCNQVFGLDEPAVGLLALTPSRGELDPPFDPDVHEYTVALSPLTSAVSLDAVASRDAVVSLDPPAPVTLAPDEPRVVTVETATVGETASYSVTFTRGAHPPDIDVLTAPTPMAGAAFGRGLAVEGDRLVVGAPDEDVGGAVEECDGVTTTPPLPPRGAVYIYERSTSGYALEQRIAVPPTARCAEFGETLALSGDLLVVGSFREVRDVASYLAGTAYVYRRAAPGDWVLVTELRPPAAYLNQYFALDVATDGHRIVVGAHGEADGNAAAAGVVYVFSADDGFSTPRRVTRTGAVGDYFGYQVELDGEAYMSTAFGEDKAAIDSGAIVPIDASLVPGDPIKLTLPMAGDHLGQSLKLRGDTMIVGTPSPSSAWGIYAGAAYVLRREGAQWSVATPLARTVGTANDRVGLRLAMTGDMFVVGACLGAATSGGWSATDTAGQLAEAGFALVYRDAGREDPTLLGVAASLVPVAGAHFSCDLAADDDQIFAGAPVESTGEVPGAGVVYIYR
jgi:hypothetical protein